MGWAVLIAALVLFPLTASGNVFLFAGLAIQISGIGLVFSGMRRGNEMRR